MAGQFQLDTLEVVCLHLHTVVLFPPEQQLKLYVIHQQALFQGRVQWKVVCPVVRLPMRGPDHKHPPASIAPALHRVHHLLVADALYEYKLTKRE